MAISNIAGVVRTHGAELGDRTAIIYQGREVTWAELDRRSNEVANALAASGVTTGDRVARVDKNGVDYFELLFGAAKINAVVVDVNYRLAPPEMAQIINDASAKMLFVGSEFAAAYDTFAAELTTVGQTVIIGDGDATNLGFDAWIAKAPATDPGVEAVGDDVCLQLYTSGTTGLPKGVMLTNNNLFSFMNEVPRAWRMSPESITHVVMPTFHIAGSGWALAGMSMGCVTVLHREVDPTAILRDVEAYRITHAIYVPVVLAFLQMVPTANDHDLSSMEFVAYGASPITQQVLVGAMKQFSTASFVQVYGLTETTGAVVQLDAEDHDPDNRPELLRSAGKPYPWIELRVVDETGNDVVAEGEIGEVWIRGVMVMKGYWNNPEATAAAISDDGWFRSGDAGYLKDGYLYLHDRVKDMIVSGGENVYPAEVENAIMGCPGVADAAVIGVPDDRWGEAVKAIVVKTDGTDVTSEQVIAWARERIAGFKVPKSVDFVETLPRNPSGKILKKDLRAPYWQDRERQIN